MIYTHYLIQNDRNLLNEDIVLASLMFLGSTLHKLRAEWVKDICPCRTVLTVLQSYHVIEFCDLNVLLDWDSEVRNRVVHCTNGPVFALFNILHRQPMALLQDQCDAPATSCSTEKACCTILDTLQFVCRCIGCLVLQDIAVVYSRCYPSVNQRFCSSTVHSSVLNTTARTGTR